MRRPSVSPQCPFIVGQRKIAVPPGNVWTWREAGGQTSFRAAAIYVLELRRREDRCRKFIATDDPGCFFKDSGRRKTSATGEF
jgi:hypothetical protein